MGGYAYNLRNQLNDEEKGIADKIDDEDKETLEEAIKEVLDWLDDNQEADAEEYEEKQKELEGIANPIMQKVYAAGVARTVVMMTSKTTSRTRTRTSITTSCEQPPPWLSHSAAATAAGAAAPLG